MKNKEQDVHREDRRRKLNFAQEKVLDKKNQQVTEEKTKERLIFQLNRHYYWCFYLSMISR